MSSHRPAHINPAVEVTFQDLESKGWTIEHSRSEFTLYYPGGGEAGTVTTNPDKGIASQQVRNIIGKK